MTQHLPWTGVVVRQMTAGGPPDGIAAELRKAGLADYATVTAGRDTPEPEAAAVLRAHAEALGDGPAELWRHVIDDRAVVSSRLRQAMQRIVAKETVDPAYDVVLTDFVVTLPHIVTLKNLKGAFDDALSREVDTTVMDLAEFKFGGANSYFVSPDARPRLQAALLAAATGATPVEAFLRSEMRAGRLRVGGVFPFMTARRIDPAVPSAADMLRLAFYAEWQEAGLEAAVAAAAARLPRDRHRDAVADIVRVMVAD